MPTPEDQRFYHAKMDEKGGIRRIDDGEVLVETVGPWQTWIGEPGEVDHSTKFMPPEKLLVTEEMAERLVAGNAALVIREPKPKRKPSKRKTKALEPEENK
jgi:hypothetical protein